MHRKRIAVFFLGLFFLSLPENTFAGFRGTLAESFSQGPVEKYIRIASGICPQKRNTRRAPKKYFTKKNPLPESSDNIRKGEQLYYKDAKPTACGLCHGIRGNGNGKLAKGLEPPPRNFTCAEIMDIIPDGQLFWVIQNGSKGTAMPMHKSTLSETETWQLIHFIRRFSK